MLNAVFWSKAAERAIKTVAQTAIASLTASGVLNVIQIDWVEIGGVSLLAGLLSILTSIAFPSQDLKEAKEAHAE
jgi:hypothetical protein